MEHFAHVDARTDELGARCLDVGHNEVESLCRARRGRCDPRTEVDRARRARRRVLQDPEYLPLVDLSVKLPAQVAIEPLGAIDVRNGDDNNFELQNERINAALAAFRSDLEIRAGAVADSGTVTAAIAASPFTGGVATILYSGVSATFGGMPLIFGAAGEPFVTVSETGVPEPTSLALLGVGAVGIAISAGHSRRRAALGRATAGDRAHADRAAGFGQAKFSPAADPKTHEPYTIPKDGFRTTYYEMVGQYGTHVDPPAHFAENDITMDKIPLKEMILPLVVLDDTLYLVKDPNHAFSIDDLKAWEGAHGHVPKGAIRRVTHRHVQRLGRRSQALRAQPVSSLGIRNNQISLRRARRDGDRPRKHGHRHD